MRRYYLQVALFALAAGLASAQGEAVESLHDRVEASIRSEERLRVYDWVQYRVQGDEVTLSGIVTLSTLPAALERRVGKTPGVARVINELEATPYSRDDMAMRVNAYWRIYGNAELNRYNNRETRSQIGREADDARHVLLQPIHIVIEDGNLTLEGEVEQQRDVTVAEAAAKQVMGVRAVSNRLVVVNGNTEERQALQVGADSWWTDTSSGVRLPVLRVENPSGRVRVQVAATNRIRYRQTSGDREVQEGDVVFDRLLRKMRLRARPADGARIDLDVDLPYGHSLEVVTVDGPIELFGLIRKADITTATGAIRLAAPWQTVRLTATSKSAPYEVRLPDMLPAVVRPPTQGAARAEWGLVDPRPEASSIYGSVEVHATAPSQLVVENMAVPVDSPVRMHWEAPDALDALFRPDRDRTLVNRIPTDAGPYGTAGGFDKESVHFSSEVRLVDLTAAVLDVANLPITGLSASDFQIIEEGIEQEVHVVDGGDAPFNLALLLDCSTSTLGDRLTVVQSAKSFVEVTRPRDQVAVHVLADTYLQVLSPLTNNRDELFRRISDIPPLSGSTPLYDALVLSYAREFAERRWERNALIVISDGMDNQILPPVGRTMPSKIPFDELLRAAAEMSAVIYPIYLESAESPRSSRDPRARAWKEKARSQLEQLAKATGGRLFRAPSIRALTHVYRDVADELRSVYRIGYYPKNQNFDGSWRQVEVKVNRRAARVRTRPGYYAW